MKYTIRIQSETYEGERTLWHDVYEQTIENLDVREVIAVANRLGSPYAASQVPEPAVLAGDSRD